MQTHNQNSEVSVFTMCENINSMPSRVFGDLSKLLTDPTTIQGIDIQARNLQNAKQLKALQYQCNMVVSSGSIHQTLARTTINSRNFRNEVEILEGTFQFFKIEMKGLQQPMKIFIKYLSVPENPVFGDLQVFVSKKVDKPEESMCDKVYSKPQCISVDVPDTTFAFDYFYIKMVSTYGCRMTIRVVFPKEDMRDRKKEQDAINNADIKNVTKKTKTKQQIDIEAKINRMLLEPRLYEEFLEEFNLRKKKMLLEK